MVEIMSICAYAPVIADNVILVAAPGANLKRSDLVSGKRLVITVEGIAFCGIGRSERSSCNHTYLQVSTGMRERIAQGACYL